jgi:DNA-binding transcriptional LysR family regulator
MDDRSLHCFIALAEELHFGRAAQRANISQPGLSGQIRRLEKRVGGALFRRTSRHVELTPAGTALLPDARAAVTAYAKGLKRSRAALKATPDRQLVIGLTNLSAQWGAHGIIDAFKAEHQRLLIETRESTSVDQESALASGELDAGFLHPPFVRTLQHEIIGSERMIAAIPRRYPLSNARSVRLADLATTRLILFPRAQGPMLYGRVLAAFQEKELAPEIAEFAAPFSAAIAAVGAGRGVALVASSFRGQQARSVAYRNIADAAIDIPIALAWRDDLDERLRASLLAHAIQQRVDQ